MATFFNRATLSYNGISRNSNVVTGEIPEPLSITKTAIPQTYRQGDTITYVISMVNTDTETPRNSLTVVDDLGNYTSQRGTFTPLDYSGSLLFYVNGVLQTPGPTITNVNPLTVTGLDIPAGANGVLVFSTTVNAEAPLGENASVLNTVTASGAGLVEPLTASEVITPETGANLNITKSLDPSVVNDGDVLTYTFTIQNSGDTEAVTADNVAISDTFNPIINISSVSLNGTALTSPADYSYDEATGEFRTTEGRITVPAATYAQDPVSGDYVVTPGVSTLTVSGTLA